MTRHSRNSTANPVYTYHEQKRDSKTGNYGTIKVRCSKESIKDFDCCSLTLQPCKDPVITPEGYLFDKAVILEYIITKKKELKKKLLEYEKQKIEYDKGSIYEKDQAIKRKNFAKSESDIVPQKMLKADNNYANPQRPVTAPLSSQFIHINLKNMAGLDTPDSQTLARAGKDLASFWVPCLTPDSNGTAPPPPPKPPKYVTCPFTGVPLTLASLFPVKFTRVLKVGGTATPSSTTLAPHDNPQAYDYVCAVTGDVINNAVPCVVLRPSGHVVTEACVERVIKRDWIDPTTGLPLTPEDIIPIRRGGTGFAQVSGDALEAKIQKPVLHG